MSARKRPTVQDAATARQALLDGVEHDVAIAEILNRLAPLRPRNDTFPGEVLTRLDEVAYWQTDDFWRYAAYTAVAYIRMAADRAGVPKPEVCRGLAQTDDA